MPFVKCHVLCVQTFKEKGHLLDLKYWSYALLTEVSSPLGTGVSRRGHTDGYCNLEAHSDKRKNKIKEEEKIITQTTEARQDYGQIYIDRLIWL